MPRSFLVKKKTERHKKLSNALIVSSPGNGKFSDGILDKVCFDALVIVLGDKCTAIYIRLNKFLNSAVILLDSYKSKKTSVFDILSI